MEQTFFFFTDMLLDVKKKMQKSEFAKPEMHVSIIALTVSGT